MEWKCCQGYSGEDCNDGPVGGAGTHISTTRPQARPGQGGGGYGGGSYGSGPSGGNSGEGISMYTDFFYTLVHKSLTINTFKRKLL